MITVGRTSSRESNPRSAHERKLLWDDNITVTPLAADSIIAIRKFRNLKLSTEIMIQNMEVVQ